LFHILNQSETLNSQWNSHCISFFLHCISFFGNFTALSQSELRNFLCILLTSK
jgi:hypothetical protein